MAQGRINLGHGESSTEDVCRRSTGSTIQERGVVVWRELSFGGKVFLHIGIMQQGINLFFVDKDIHPPVFVG
jgi:hypothetical protein